MTEFGSAIAQWVAFYTLAGGASATLAGLLFVAVSLHIDLIVDEHFPDAQALSRQTFYTFVYVIIISLIVIIPNQSPPGVATTMILAATFALLQEIRVVGETLRLMHDVQQGVQRALFLLRRLLTPIICYVAMLVISIAILNGQSKTFGFLAAVIILLLANATGNSWNLLVRMAQARRAMEAGENPRSHLSRRKDDKE